MERKVTLNKREQKRLMVLNHVEKGKMRGEDAAVVLAISVRHVRKQVIELARSTCAGCNTRHYSELLSEREGIELSRSRYAVC